MPAFVAAFALELEVTQVKDHEFTLSLVIRHPDIDPARITNTLGLQPGHVWRKGEQRMDPAGAGLGGNHRESYWLCEIVPRPKFPGENHRAESELSRVVQMLRKSLGFMQDLHHDGGVIQILVTVFARGDFRLELLPEDAALLGRIGACLAIEVRSGQMIAAA